MGHEIEEHDHMFSAGRTPWHSLGTVTAEALKLDDALEIARLTWRVNKAPIFTLDESGAMRKIPERFATVRSDTGEPLGVVGKSYKPLQNEEGFALLGALLEGGEVEVETAGSLRNGRYVWALARMHRDLRIEGDEHVPYVLFTNTHDGSAAVRIITTPVRVVCMNTLRWALSRARSSWTARHTQGMTARVQEARETLGLAWAYFDEFEEEARRLIDKTISDAQFEQIAAQVFPGDPKAKSDPKAAKSRKHRLALAQRGEVGKIWTDGPEVGQFRGTAWGALQAFSTWDLWQRPVRGQGANGRDAGQALRVLSGRTAAFADQVRAEIEAVAR